MSNSSFYIITPNGRYEKTFFKSCVIALGTFDGVHIAHKMLLERAIKLKHDIGAACVGAWCFSESPTQYLSGKNIPSLCTVDEKVSMMLSLGLDFVAVGDFHDYCKLTAEEFINDVLKNQLSCIGAVCGFNHHFGCKGKGDPLLLLREFGHDNTAILPEIKLENETVSSSGIKNSIMRGEMDHAATLLGRPFSVRSTVVTGKNLGHTLGFPTANHEPFTKSAVIPKRGIYATICITDDGKRHVAITNVGTRPTITDGSDNHVTNCETHIHDFNENIYGKEITVEFYKYLREEQKFDSIKLLRDQISRDLKEAIAFFKEHPEYLFPEEYTR